MKFTTISLAASLITDAVNSQILTPTKGHLRAEHAADNANRALTTPESSSMNEKLGKSRKSSKDQCETTSQALLDGLEFPSGDQLAQLEKRYGKLISNQKKLDDIFCVKYNAVLSAKGANILVGASPRVDAFVGSNSPMTADEVKTVCMTRCADNPRCDFVSLSRCDCGKKVAPDSFPEGVDWSCNMYSLDFGVSFVQEDLLFPDDFQYSLLLKHGVEIPNFSEAWCDIPPSDEFIFAAGCAGCLGEGGSNEFCTGLFIGLASEKTCQDLVTADFVQHVVPALQCLTKAALVAAEDPEEVIQGCLGCIVENTLNCENSAANICTEDPDFNTIAGRCGDVCFGVECLSQIQQANLCTLGTRTYLTSGDEGYKRSGGCINSAYDDVTDAFTCPSLD